MLDAEQGGLGNISIPWLRWSQQEAGSRWKAKAGAGAAVTHIPVPTSARGLPLPKGLLQETRASKRHVSSSFLLLSLSHHV